MKYSILYNYDNGDSFTNECGLERYLELSWDNIDVAKQNLNRIKEHYILYNKINDLNRYYKNNKTNIEKLIENNKDKDWFVKQWRLYAVSPKGEKEILIDESDKPKYKKRNYTFIKKLDYNIAKHCLILYTDDGNKFQLHAPWCGYFERLNNVKVIENDLDLFYDANEINI